MKVSEQSVAIVTPGVFRLAFIKIARYASLDAILCLAANVDLSNTAAIRKTKAIMSKRKPEQSFCYAPTEESGCILSMQFFSGNLSRG